MALMLAAITFLAFWVYLVWFIIRIFKRKPKKKPAIGMLVCVILFFGCAIVYEPDEDMSDSENTPPTSESQRAGVQRKSEPKSEPEQEPETEFRSAAFDERGKAEPAPAAPAAPAEPVENVDTVSNEEEKVSLEYIADMFELVLAESYSGYNVSVDDAGINVNVWTDGVATALAFIQASGGGADDENWVAAKNGTLAMAKSLRGIMDDLGHEDDLLVVNALNDMDTSKTLLSIVNTDIIYDVLA